MTVEPGDRIRRNDPRFVDEGSVVRVEGRFVVVRWDHGSSRLTTVSLGDVKPPTRPRSSRYSLIGRAA